MPVVVATITPLPDHREEVRTTLEASVTKAHREPGCQLYALHESEDSFVFIEQWESDADLERHNVGEVVRDVVAVIGDKLKEPVHILKALPIPGGDPTKGRLVD